MIYYEKTFVLIVWNEEVQCLELAWRGHVPEAELPAALKALKTLAARKKAAGMVVDMTQAGPLNHTMREQVNETNPHLIASGLIYTALVMPQRETVRASLEAAPPPQDSPDTRIILEFFTDKAEALAWLSRKIHTL